MCAFLASASKVSLAERLVVALQLEFGHRGQLELQRYGEELVGVVGELGADVAPPREVVVAGRVGVERVALGCGRGQRAGHGRRLVVGFARNVVRYH